MGIEVSERDFAAIEDAAGEIKAAVVRMKMGTEQQKAEKREELLEKINFQAGRILTHLENGDLLPKVQSGISAPTEAEIEALEDLREFRRLRNYYRRNYTNGHSDESFIVWCEDMCERERNQGDAG